MNWIDITILVILLVNIGMGWSKGLIRSVTNLVSIVLGFIFAKLYYLQMYELLDDRFNLFVKIRDGVSQTFSSIQFPETSVLETMSPEQLSQTVGNTEYLRVISEKFFESDKFKMMLSSNVENFSNGFASWLAENIMNVLSMVVVFIVVFVAVRIIGYFLGNLFKLPILKGVNKFSGLLFGFVKGIFFAMLFVLLLAVIGPFFDHDSIIATLEQSSIGIYFYKYNLIMLIFESMI